MLEGTRDADAGAEEGEGSERGAGAVGVPLTEAGAAAAAVVAAAAAAAAVVVVVVAAAVVVVVVVVAAAVVAADLAAAEEVLAAAEEVWDEEVLPCDWVEKAAEAWNCAKLWMQSTKKGTKKKYYICVCDQFL